MTRLEIEKEILSILGLIDPNGNIMIAGSNPPLRTYIQNKINSAVEGIYNENPWSFRRKEFSVYINAPITGTIAFTQGQKTATVTGQTPASTWVGCHMVLSQTVYPLRVESFAGQIITFAQPINIPSSLSLGFSLYFDGFMLPDDCQKIEEKTVKLDGNRQLKYMNRVDFQRYTGYYREDTDYHFVVQTSAIVQLPDVGQPIVYTSWGNVTLSSKIRRVLNLYPYPSTTFAVTFDGFKKPALLTADGDIPDLPEQFHRSCLLPRVKFEMCDYPGFEVSAQEKATATQTYADNIAKLNNEDRQDAAEVEPYRPSPFCQ